MLTLTHLFWTQSAKNRRCWGMVALARIVCRCCRWVCSLRSFWRCPPSFAAPIMASTCPARFLAKYLECGHPGRMQFTELKVKPRKKISRIALLKHLTNYSFQLNNQNTWLTDIFLQDKQWERKTTSSITMVVIALVRKCLVSIMRAMRSKVPTTIWGGSAYHKAKKHKCQGRHIICSK